MKKWKIIILIISINVISALCNEIDITQLKQNLLGFKCTNCKSVYKFTDNIAFNIIYYGEKTSVKFGIKIKIDEKWMLLVEDIGSAFPRNESGSNKVIFKKTDDNIYSQHSIWPFLNRQKRKIIWNKKVSLSLEKYEKYKKVMSPFTGNEGELIQYDINKGGTLKLFVYYGSPYPNPGFPQRDLNEFILEPNKNTK